MLQIELLCKRLLEQLQNKSKGTNLIESVNVICEYLENKEDPETYEIELISDMYQLQERLRIIESELNMILKKSLKRNLLGEKINELHNKIDFWTEI